MKRLAILGSTGSIGRQTLEVISSFPTKFRVIGLAAGRNTTLLAKQVEEFKPKLVSSQIMPRLLSSNYEFLTPEEIACHPEVDLLVVATSGKAGLKPTLAAIQAGKPIVLANKEVLVMAGELIISEAKQHQVQILPVDSEHSAIWQCLQGEKSEANRLLLTASGGPFYFYTEERLATVTPEEALKHPTWQMGKKVTIDSATLMNKGMETIEAHWFFNIPLERIEVIIHRESVIHSLVEFVDGAIKAQLAFPDMRLPIQYALTYPERLPNPKLPRLDFTKIKSLTFAEVDWERFPCPKLAIEAAKSGGTYPAVLCAADEVAVQLFLKGKIAFLDIPRIIGETLNHHQNILNPTLEEIIAADFWARKIAAEMASRGSPC